MLKPRDLLLAGIAALAPLSGSSLAEPAGHTGSFIPPGGPMTLTRTVSRDLHDGKTIRVSRSYAITITADGDGYLVDGTLIDTAVDAPAEVAMIAEIERKRTETGVFPFHLDAEGLITTRAADASAAAANGDFARAGAALVARSDLPGPARQETQAMLDQVIGAARGGVAWPRDLFNPASERHQDQRNIQLQGGTTGKVKVSIAVDRANPGQLPRSVERTVTTTLGDTESVTREQWTMGPR